MLCQRKDAADETFDVFQGIEALCSDEVQPVLDVACTYSLQPRICTYRRQVVCPDAFICTGGRRAFMLGNPLQIDSRDELSDSVVSYGRYYPECHTRSTTEHATAGSSARKVLRAGYVLGQSKTYSGAVNIPFGTLGVPNHNTCRFAGNKNSGDPRQSWSHDAAEQKRSCF